MNYAEAKEYAKRTGGYVSDGIGMSESTAYGYDPVRDDLVSIMRMEASSLTQLQWYPSNSRGERVDPIQTTKQHA